MQSCRELTVVAAAKLFYFQQQVNAGAVCSALLQKYSHLAISPASQTFAHGNMRCFTIIRTWQSSNGPLVQSLSRAGKASRRMTPVDLR